MKKRIISALAILLMVAGTANAQVFMMDRDSLNQRAEGDPNYQPFIPGLGETNDQGYVPAGSGALLLAGLAGVYLIGKKKKK